MIIDLSYALKPEIKQAIKELGFKEFTEIQKLVLDKITYKASIIAESQTGSGKTHAFLFPLFNEMDLKINKVQGVIIAPTKELISQIANFAEQINKHFSQEFKILILKGGSDRLREIEKIRKNYYHLVIATPGKLFDYCVKEGILNISTAKYLVIDEADMALDLGFLPEMQNIIAKIKDKRVFLFSATLPEQIKSFIKKIVKNQEFIHLKADDFQSLLISHNFIKVKNEANKDKYLLELIKAINPYLCLIFANTNEEVARLAKFLKQESINVVALHSDIEKRVRKKIMEKIDKLEYQYLVCSDICARGIDIKGVSHVINFELPKDFAFYLHRTGRTGRAKMSGESYSFYSHNALGYPQELRDKGVSVNFSEVKDREIKVLTKEKEIEPEVTTSKIKTKTKRVAPNYKKKFAQKNRNISKKESRKR